MNTIELPIFGKGSQPPEEDGATLEYLSLPQAMNTYEMPQLSMPSSLKALLPAKNLLKRLLLELERFAPDQASKPLSLFDMDAESLQFVGELLGEGEVSIVYSGTRKLRIQESILAGVWRLQQTDEDGRVVEEWLEVGGIPTPVLRYGFDDADAVIDTTFSSIPQGVMNAPPILTELNAKMAEYESQGHPHVINLSLLPQTDEDLAFLSERLGDGRVTILARGYGNCRISSTNTRNVWWVRYFNSEDALLLNTLEVAQVPIVACAAPEDLADSKERLQEMLKVYL
ncbi:MAG: hydrogenase expression/formation protein [Gammaproteobacteria bacterium]